MPPVSRNISLAGALLLAAAVPAAVRGDEIPREYQETVKKGLDWLARNQFKDGHWEGTNGHYRIPMTGMAGVALLCEGSTIREGKYRDNIRRATDYLMARIQPNGLIGDPARTEESGRYMYGHGFGLLFLSCVVGEEENVRRREKLVEALEKAAKYTHDAQTNRGGWGYVSAKDGGNFDEGSVTITQVQALRAARNAGIIVPKDAISKAQKYLVDSTDSSGGVMYSLAWGGGGGGGGRPALTAAAIACGFSAGDYNSPTVVKWLKYCQLHLSTPGDGRRMGHDEYTHYYYAQVAYVLGDDRFKKFVPEARSDEALTWSKYRKSAFEEHKRTQSADGSWGANGAWGVGPVYVTAINLTIMQLDKAALPIYQR